MAETDVRPDSSKRIIGCQDGHSAAIRDQENVNMGDKNPKKKMKDSKPAAKPSAAQTAPSKAKDAPKKTASK